MSSSSVFSAQAQEAALGYLYQVQCALWLLLQMGYNDPELCLFLEKLDDISFEKDGTPIQLLQTKHHTDRVASLSDASPDLWKTVRIWGEALLNGKVQAEHINLTLITTAEATADSAASMLRPDASGMRNVDTALSRLNTTARTSTSAANRAAYDVFLRLNQRQQRLLLSSMYILDRSPGILEVEEKIACCLRYSATTNHLATLCKLVEGWWLETMIKHLRAKSTHPIAHSDLQLALAQFRPMFQQDNLPDDMYDIPVITEQAALEDQRIFVEQLRIIGCKVSALQRAIVNYYRASTRRSRWVRDGFLFGDDLERYENVLQKEWERMYESMEDDLGCNPTEEEIQKAGKKLFQRIEDVTLQPAFFIRPHFHDPYLARGTFHILANTMSIGWHIDFRLYLQHLLS